MAHHIHKHTTLSMQMLLVALLLVFTTSGCVERGYHLQVQPKARSASAQQVSNLDTRHTPPPPGLIDKMIRAVKSTLQKPQNQTAQHTQTVAQKVITATANTHAAKRIVRHQNTPPNTPSKPQQKLAQSHTQKAPLHHTPHVTTQTKQPNRTDTSSKPQSTTHTHHQPQTSPNLEKQTKLQALTQTEQIIKERKKRLEKKLQTLMRLNQDLTPPDAQQGLHFIPIKQTFFKYGTSEIHGHVIYLDHLGEEYVPKRPIQVYLVPQSVSARHWYENYYLKGKIPQERTAISYIQKTTVDLNQNFAFYGVAQGSYFVIIVASNAQNNQKIYIAKKLQIGKYKKVVTVLSKKQ